MKVLITGSEGFIGIHLKEHLMQLNYDVYGLDIKPSTSNNFRVVDILDYSSLLFYCDEIKPDIIVHLAARIDISDDDVTDYSTNIVGVQNLINVSENISSVKRVIWTSSQLVNKLGYIRLNNINYKPTTSYGASKAIGELLVKTQVHNKEWTIIRPTNVWGPNMSEHYRKFLSYVNSRKYFHVAFSDIYKSYSYVANACFQIEKIISSNAVFVNKKTFYICDYEPIEVKNWVNRFAFYFGVKKPITFPYTLSFLVVNIFDILKNISVLKRVPITKYTFQNILTHYIIENRELHSVTGDLPFNNEQGIKITSKWFKNLN